MIDRVLNDSMYSELQKWQTAIGALLGFLALLAGALWNFHLNRRRDRGLRQEEKLSVAAALYGEVLLLRDALARLARVVAAIHLRQGLGSESVTKFDEHFIEAWSLPAPILYGALAAKIGLLEPDLVLGITSFHANYSEANRSLRLLVDKPTRGYGYSILTFLRPALDAVTQVEPILNVIEAKLAISTPAPTPDLGDAKSVREMEEDFHHG